ncbi:MAG TPA: phytanoyl-CoA dioxygenase family protein [Candidatus Acidoferrum sp.]|nr:phytanoyl-CoA dioxygenase family protein [Candidatus Acidoferrum sp.]
MELIQQKGYAILPAMVEQSAIAALLAELDGVALPRTRAGIRHAMKLPAVSGIARSERLMAMAQAVLGKDAFPFRATLFEKSSTANWLVVWHQDTALPLQRRHEAPGWGPWSIKDGLPYAHAPASALSQVLALRLHLDDSTSENGPLRVLPGTHTLGVLTDESLHELSAQIAAVECLVPAGGVLAMRPLIVHASCKSVSSALRRVLHIEFAAAARIAAGMELAIA